MVAFRLVVDPSDPRPIWRQIEEGVRLAIARRELAPGDAVPSVRELARLLRVNPNTVARAYQRLGEAGVFEVRRGEGTYVASAVPGVAKAERRKGLQEAAQRFAETAARLSAGREEALEAVAGALDGLLTEEKEER
ncbi:MAG TPA: GntR family transcriptional regulator [Thermoanaerobaculia bacterium]|nr:GntR family transcriptional regulator [Thermoanaerobaculia bacterium]